MMTSTQTSTTNTPLHLSRNPSMLHLTGLSSLDTADWPGNNPSTAQDTAPISHSATSAVNSASSLQTTSFPFGSPSKTKKSSPLPIPPTLCLFSPGPVHSRSHPPSSIPKKNLQPHRPKIATTLAQLTPATTPQPPSPSDSKGSKRPSPTAQASKAACTPSAATILMRGFAIPYSCRAELAPSRPPSSPIVWVRGLCSQGAPLRPMRSLSSRP